MGPIGGARVGYINGQYVLNPPVDQMKDSKLDLVVAGTADAVLMVESEAQELPEDVMLGAVMFGHRSFQPIIDAIIRLAERAAKEPRDYQANDQADLYGRVRGDRRGGTRPRLFDHRQGRTAGHHRLREEPE
jgi:polyribonucleotide nucleotidyltransferase